MSRARVRAHPASARTILAAALARAEAWLLEPAAQAGEPARAPAGRFPVVAVFGLGPRCGATVVARALAAELGARAGRTAAVHCTGLPGATPLASASAGRLARTLAEVPGARTRAVGRLCLVDGPEPLALADTTRHHAPLVLDAGAVAVGGAPAAVADLSVLVAVPRLEPALAAAAAECLSRVARGPLVALNRVRPGEEWAGIVHTELPESRAGAQLALGGRPARGRLGAAVAALADVVAELSV